MVAPGSPREGETRAGLRAVLLDAGGTLIHMPRSSEDVLQELCGEMGISITPEEARAACLRAEGFYSEHYLGYAGDQGEFWLRFHGEALRSLGIHDPTGEKAAHLSHGFGRAEIWQAYPEAASLCRQLRSLGFRLGVVSNGPTNVPDMLSQAGLLPFFEVVVTSQGAGMEKPDPRIFALALESLGVSPAEALFVGDIYEIDVLGARSAGLEAVLIDREGGAAERDCLVISSLEELIGHAGARGQGPGDGETGGQGDGEESPLPLGDGQDEGSSHRSSLITPHCSQSSVLSPESSSSDPDPLAAATAAVLRRLQTRPAVPGPRPLAPVPLVGVILGSGLGAVADQIEGAICVPYGEIPGFPCTTVVGHPGELVLGTLEGVGIVAMKGRHHLYEGYTPAQVGFPVRLLHSLGVRVLVVTNAAGGLRPGMAPGTLLALEDHLNLPGLGGANPLVGVAGGPERFVNMAGAYDESLRQLILEGAQGQGIRVASGVYAMVAGPSYETPAEARLLRQWGADAVGMSTVPEVVVARWLGMRVLGISCITNVLLGPADHEHGEGGHLGVLSAAETTVPDLAFLLRLLMRHLKEAMSDE